MITNFETNKVLIPNKGGSSAILNLYIENKSLVSTK